MTMGAGDPHMNVFVITALCIKPSLPILLKGINHGEPSNLQFVPVRLLLQASYRLPAAGGHTDIWMEPVSM